MSNSNLDYVSSSKSKNTSALLKKIRNASYLQQEQLSSSDLPESQQTTQRARKAKISKPKTDESSSIQTLKNTYTLISPRSDISAIDKDFDDINKNFIKKSVDAENGIEETSEPATVNFEFPEKYSDYDEDNDCINSRPYHGSEVEDAQHRTLFNNGYDKEKIKFKMDQIRENIKSIKNMKRSSHIVKTHDQNAENLEELALIEEDSGDNEDERESKLSQIMLRASRLLGKNYILD